MNGQIQRNYHKCVYPDPLNVLLVKHLSAEPIFRCHNGDVTFEIEKGSSVLAEWPSHMSARGSVNPGICECRALNFVRQPHSFFSANITTIYTVYIATTEKYSLSFCNLEGHKLKALDV